MARAVVLPMLLTAKQTAKVLQCYEKTVRLMVNRGRLKAYRLGDGNRSELRIPVEAVEAMLRREPKRLAKIAPPMRRRIDETERGAIQGRASPVARRNTRKPDDDGDE